jgi:hypothetical protein
MLAYRAALPLPSQTLTTRPESSMATAAGLAHSGASSSRVGRPLLVLPYLRKGETYRAGIGADGRFVHQTGP